MACKVLGIKKGRFKLKDEEYLFFSDSFEKKNIARSSHNKRTHTGKGGCTLPSDKYTKKELQSMNGEVKSYRMNDPIKWAEFKTWPDEHQATYLKLLRKKYNVSDATLAKMFGVAPATVSAYLRKKGLNRSGAFSGKEEWDKEGFWRWANGVPAETAEEIPAVECCTDDRIGAINVQIEAAEGQAETLEFVPELGICEPDSGLEALDAMMEEEEQTERKDIFPESEPIYIITLKEKTLLERAVGMLEGLSYGAQHCISEGIIDAVQMIDSVLNKHKPIPGV